MDFEDFTKKYWESSSEEEDTRVRDRIWRAVKRSISPKERRVHRLRIISVVAAAAAVAVIVCFSAISYFSADNAVTEEDMVVRLAQTEEEVRLPDGSKVWLAAGSTLKYSSDLEKSRKVTLIGNATFDVAKAEDGRHFIVNLGHSYIEVKGTVFTVTKESHSAVSVTLFSGAVDFVSNSDGHVQSLSPSNQLVYDFCDNSVSVKPFFKGISWRDGSFIMEGASLSDIAEFVGWRYDVTVNVDSSVGNSQKVNGRIDYDESLSAVLEKLAYMLSLDYEKRDTTYLIRNRSRI